MNGPGEVAALRAPLITTKLAPPVLPAAYRPRDRIRARLDTALDPASRLALVSAPAGYGKTVAVAAWLRSVAVPWAWLSLDRDDDDLARFVRYLVAALRTVRPGFGGETLGLFGAGAAPAPDVLAATLLGELGGSEAPFILVVDDYQVVSSEAVHRLVRFLVEYGPPFAHLVLAGREDPPLPLARLRAGGRLVELRGQDLQFTGDEASDFLARGLGLQLGDAATERLTERTEGWAVGLQLAGLSLRDRPPSEAASIAELGGERRFVLDYLADEVLDGLDPELRRFLAEVSVVERFGAEVARELTGRADAAELLARAEAANLFIVPLDDERRWYRFHGLFREYLQRQLGADERRALEATAAGCLERLGLDDEAIGHALASGSAERAIRLVGRQARAAFDAGELDTLLRWLDALPAGAVESSAELASLRPWACFFAGDLDGARRTADAARLDPTARGASIAAARIVAVRGIVAILTGEPFDGGVLEAGVAALGDDPFFRSLALLGVGEAQLSRGTLRAAQETLEEALAGAMGTGQPMAIFPIAYLLATVRNVLGCRPDAEELCRGLLDEFGVAAGRPSPVAGLARIALGTLRFEANDLVEARRELERGLASASSLGFARVLLGLGVASLALVRELTGAGEEATAAVATGSRNARSLGIAPAVPQAGAIEAELALLRGDLPAAARWADAAVAMPEPPDGLIPRVRIQRDTVLARVRLAQRRLDDARRTLAAVRAVAAPEAVAYVVSIDVLRAGVAEAEGRRDDAIRILTGAVRAAAPGRYVQRLVRDGPPIAHLLPLVRKAAPAFVDEVLAGLEGSEPSRRAHAGPSLWRPERAELLETLTGRELDVLRALARGAANAAIAEELSLSLATVKWHVRNVLAKLDAASRTEAVVRAQELGLL